MTSNNASDLPIPLRRTDDGRILAQPDSIGELYRFAAGLAKSGLIPDALRGKPNDIAIILLTSLEKGVPLMAGLQQIAVIHGKPFLEASLMQAICVSHPDVCEYVRPIEVSDKGATWEAKRVGWPEPYRATYGPKDAERAGKAGSATYKAHPGDMYSARACARACRRVFPELVGGMYVPSERAAVAAEVVVEETPGVDVAAKLADVVSIVTTSTAPDLLAGIPDPDDGE